MLFVMVFAVIEDAVSLGIILDLVNCVVVGSPDLDGGSSVPVPVIFLSRSKSCASFSFCQMLNYTNCDVAPNRS